MLQKGCPPQPTHGGWVVSPDKVISSKEKHCWLCTLTSLSSWHLWAPNMSTGCFQEGMGPCRQMAGRVTCHRNGMCFKGWVTGSKYSSRDVRTAVWPGCLHRRSKEYPFASHCSSGCEELGTWHLYGVYMIKALSWHYLIKQHSTLLRRVWPSIHWWESRWGKLGVLATSASARISHLPSQCLFL